MRLYFPARKLSYSAIGEFASYRRLSVRPGLALGSFKPFFTLLLLILFVSPALADPTFPALTGRVVDSAKMLSAADQQSLSKKLQQLEQQSTDQLVVVTLPGLQGYSIEDFGIRLARHWQIGQKGKNNGVLLLVAPKDRKVRIEVGYGLEGTLTDTLAGNIVHNRILPLFRKGQMAEGIKRGVDDIIDTLSGDAAAVAQRAKGKGRSSRNTPPWPVMIIWALWMVMMFSSQLKSLFTGSSERGGVIIVPVGEPNGSWNSVGPGGSSGGFGGGGGGGFSGGGGSFGGGGASGGW